MSLYHVKDNSFKLIFGNHELFVQFLRDFIHIDLLKDVRPEDIEDVRERYIPLFQDSRESDTVKRINLKDTTLFVIAVVEHESKVNFRTSFKMLQYICFILDAYEKEQVQLYPGCITRKEFKYPPVLPVVFYDGPDTWTAETNFLGRTALNEVFEKYIPKFEYELVDLHRYNPQEIARFNDVLSLVMLIDRLGTIEGENLLKKLPANYLEKLSLKIPENLSKLLADVVTVLMDRFEVPRGEIEGVIDRFRGKEGRPMFDALVEKYKRTRAEDLEKGLKKGRQEGRQEGKQEGKQDVGRAMKKDGLPLEQICKYTGLSPEAIEKL
ncbi:transposase [Spirochaetia bacterium]|nr:transposase [Spirochaetia bacterium]